MPQCVKKYEVLPFLIQNNHFYLFCQKRAQMKKFCCQNLQLFLSIDFSSQDPFVFKNHVLTKNDFPYSRASHWFLVTKKWIQSLRNFLSFLLTKEFNVYWKLFLLSIWNIKNTAHEKKNLWRLCLNFRRDLFLNYIRRYMYSTCHQCKNLNFALKKN